MPVSVPQLACSGCRRPTSLWMPLCATCASLADQDDEAPVIGERFRDIALDIARNSNGD